MNKNLFVCEEWVNATKGHRLGSSGVYETWCETLGELYHAMQKEYGRCTSKVYIDTDKGPRTIGWVFIKRQKYTDCNDTYLQETWVTVHEKEPVKSIEYFYA